MLQQVLLVLDVTCLCCVRNFIQRGSYHPCSRQCRECLPGAFYIRVCASMLSMYILGLLTMMHSMKLAELFLITSAFLVCSVCFLHRCHLWTGDHIDAAGTVPQGTTSPACQHSPWSHVLLPDAPSHGAVCSAISTESGLLLTSTPDWVLAGTRSVLQRQAAVCCSQLQLSRIHCVVLNKWWMPLSCRPKLSCIKCDMRCDLLTVCRIEPHCTTAPSSSF